MPIEYRIDAESGLILTTASGVLTDEEVIAHRGRLAADPAVRPGMRELSDIRGIEKLGVTPAGIQAMVRQDEEKGPAGGSHKLALVLSRDVAYGMARMYQTMTEPTTRNVGVFRDLDEAAAWLRSE